MTKAAIELKNITKTFGSVVANKDVSLTVNRGEILSILGENGSGKTTLMNMISGIYFPDEGRIFVNGEEVVIRSPKDAFDLKIGMIHQHFKLVDNYTAADNIILGSKQGFFLKKDRKDEVRRLSEKYKLDINPDKKIYDMSVSEKQTVEILKVLYRGAKILILDEPTAVLTPQETKKLFDILRNMKKEGCAIVIITHKLAEVKEISDRVTVLRKGECVATAKTSEKDVKGLAELMVGKSIEFSIDRPKRTHSGKLLEIYRLTVKDNDGIAALRDVTFNLHAGEILGVAGVAGSGQKQLCEAIAGLLPVAEGAILHKKVNIVGKTPQEIINLGISMSFIPEDRLGMGLAGSMGIMDNMLLKDYSKGKSPFLNKKNAKKRANELVSELKIYTPDIYTPVKTLSGGNVQKVLLGREIGSCPNVLITAYPVRGLDINASYLIYDLINEQKQKGTAVLFIGEDLDVMLELCDRIMVLCHGEVTGILKAEEATKEKIGLMMTAAEKKEDEEDE